MLVWSWFTLDSPLHSVVLQTTASSAIFSFLSVLCLSSCARAKPLVIPSKPPQSTAGTQREPTGGTLGWELWDRIGGKNQYNTTMKESEMWGVWLNDRLAGSGVCGVGVSSRALVLSTFSPPRVLFTFFPLLKIFLKEVLAFGRSDPVRADPKY